MPRRYAILDVFANRALAGNPLAVVLDAQGLDTASMQAIGREFNLSETVFVLPPEDASQRARIRIFTPGMEMPFAGHPTVGTAVLLARDAGETTARFVLGENIGPVACEVEFRDGIGRARFVVPGRATIRGEAAPVPLIAEALGLRPDDIGFPGHRSIVAGVGFAFTFVPVPDRATLRRIRLNTAVWQGAFGQDGLGAAFVYTPDVEGSGHAFRARMFSPGDGIPEDPATGSAVASLTAVIMAFDRPADGEHRFVIEQGYEMGRPSIIELGMSVAGGACVAATIMGEAVIVAEGLLHV